MWYNGMSWWMLFGGIWMFLILGGIIALIIWAVTRFSRPGGTAGRQDPLDIARERYARGDITREQFDQIKRDLRG
jgi:putative membrane protein